MVLLGVSFLLQARVIQPWVRRRIIRIESELSNKSPAAMHYDLRFQLPADFSDDRLKVWVAMVLFPALQRMGVEINGFTLRRGSRVWSASSNDSPIRGTAVLTTRLIPVAPRDVCGQWVSVVDATGRRRFSFLLPGEDSRERGIVVCRELCRASGSQNFTLEISGMPGSEGYWTLSPGWTGLFTGQIGGLILVGIAWAAGMSRCAKSSCLVSQGLNVRDLWLALGLILPFLSWVVVYPVTRKYGDDLYFRGPAGAARSLLTSLPVAMALAAGIAVMLPVSIDSWIFPVFATLNVINSVLLVHVAANRGVTAVTTLWGMFALFLAWFPRLWYLPPVTGIVAGAGCVILDAIKSSGPGVFAGVSGDEEPSMWSRVYSGIGSLVTAAVTAGLLWGDKIAMMSLFPEETTRHGSSATFLVSVMPALFVCGMYFTRCGIAMSRLWNATATAMCRSSIPVLAISRKLMIPAFDQMVAELAIALQASCLGSVLILGFASPDEVTRYLPLVYASGLSGLAFAMAVYLSMLSAGLASFLQLTGSILFSVVLMNGLASPMDVSFEAFCLGTCLAGLIGLPMVVAHARRVTSLPEYRFFWRKHALL
jgi:hypothetical protein